MFEEGDVEMWGLEVRREMKGRFTGLFLLVLAARREKRNAWRLVARVTDSLILSLSRIKSSSGAEFVDLASNLFS